MDNRSRVRQVAGPVSSSSEVSTSRSMPAPTRAALFLDRDGVINVDRGFVSQIKYFQWQPGIFDAARTAVRLRLALVVITNQSGIGRGYYTEQDYQGVTAYMREK